jgi:hypothetical protein
MFKVCKFQVSPIHPPLGDFQLVSEPSASLRVYQLEVMSEDHTKREIVIGDKAKGSGRNNKEWTPSKESGDKYKEESASSIKSHRKGDKKKNKNEEGGLLRDRLFITFHIRRRVYYFEAPRAQEV